MNLTRLLHNLTGTLRQLQFPAEFGIRGVGNTTGLESELREITRLLKELPKDGGDPPPTDWTEKLRFFSDVATGVWRLRKRMSQPGSDRPREELRREFTHLQSVWDALHQNGFVIQEHTDKKFDTGQSLKVVAFQPTAGLTYEKVIDTIKPSIYYQNQRIQMGEVIVGTPDNSSSPGSLGNQPTKSNPPSPNPN